MTCYCRGFMNKKKKITIILTSVVMLTILIITLLFVFCRVIPNRKEEEEWKLAIKQYRNTKISKYIEENENYDDYEVDVAFLGDSLTDGYNVELYYPQYLVANRGIGGDTTFDLENRLQVSVYDLKPKVAVMLIGANNFRTMFDNYESIVKGLKYNLPNTEIVLLSLTSMSGELWGINNELAAFNNVKIKLIANKYTCTFVDLYTPLFDYSSNGIKPEYTLDGGHLTSSGYEVITKVITPVLDNLLQN